MTLPSNAYQDAGGFPAGAPLPERAAGAMDPDIPVLTDVLAHTPPPVDSLPPVALGPSRLERLAFERPFRPEAEFHPDASQARAGLATEAIFPESASSLFATLEGQDRSISEAGARSIWPQGRPGAPAAMPVITAAPSRGHGSAGPLGPGGSGELADETSPEALSALELRIWSRLERRLTHHLDVQIQLSLARLVDRALEDALAELKLGLRESLRMMLAETVHDELRQVALPEESDPSDYS